MEDAVSPIFNTPSHVAGGLINNLKCSGQSQPECNELYYPTSELECIPSEVILLICKELPIESRIALALTSHTMMFKTGGIGRAINSTLSDEATVPGTRKDNRGDHDNDVDDEEDDWEEADEEEDPRMPLLELLERDHLLLTRCDYCRVLHSALWSGNDGDGERCGELGNSVSVRSTKAPITLPLVRAAARWSRQGLDADSLLAHARGSHVEDMYQTSYRIVTECRPRVARGSVILRNQLFVARKAPYGPIGHPSARDVCALGELYQYLTGWAPDLGYPRGCLEGMAKPNCSCIGNHHTYRCYPDDNGPRLAALPPRLRCLLNHPMPCRYATCRRKKFVKLGRVDGDHFFFLDHSVNAIPAPEGPWDRVLVFTSWHNLGDGSSRNDVRWVMRPTGSFQVPWQVHKSRKDNGSRRGDAYEPYEGAGEGTLYVPELPRSVAKKLFSPVSRSSGAWLSRW
jgi:hypothetical protein